MTRILLDQGLAPGCAAILRERGWDAIHVSELGMDKASDADILARALADDRICVTLDHDFHSHLAIAAYRRPSVIFLRVQGLAASGQADLIRSVCFQCEEALSRGAAVSANSESIRFRRLPLK